MRPEDKNVGKSVYKIIEEVIEEMCKDYCRHPREDNTEADMDDICSDCPLNRLY